MLWRSRCGCIWRNCWQREVEMSSHPSYRWKGIVLAAAVFACLVVLGCRRSRLPPPPVSNPAPEQADIAEQVHNFCGVACHAYPPPDTFPRWAWKQEVARGFRFFEQSGLPLKPPPPEQVIRYYEQRAPEELPAAKIIPADHPLPVLLEKTGWPGPSVPQTPSISFVHLPGSKRPNLLACDMRNGLVMRLPLEEAKPTWRVIAHLANPAHAEVVDLDGDGILDILVADLGSFSPTERRCGKVVWLR